MITFEHVLTESEVNSQYINLTDDRGDQYGDRIAKHGVVLEVVDGEGRKFFMKRHHGNQLTRCSGWFLRNAIKPNTRTTITFDPVNSTLRIVPTSQLPPAATPQTANPTHQPPAMNPTTIIRRPAARVAQGNLKLYATSLRARDLLAERFYDIERLDPEDPNQGYQRVLNKGRAKKLADYLLGGHDDGDAFLPTSIFLATDKPVDYDEATNTLSFDIREVGPFSVVDGQHRLEGLRMAATECPALLDFEVAVNIAANLPKIAQMCHFLIVNTTQKSVDASVSQRIFARLTTAIGVDPVPNLPKWIQRVVESGDDEQALRIADYLNRTPGSPWQRKIEMANEENSAATIKQKTFVKALKQFVLTANNPLSLYPSDRQQRIMLNYWAAIAKILDTGEETVLFKFSGSELFSRFSIPFFTKLANSGDFTAATMERLLRQTFDNLDGDSAGVGHPDWWLSGTGAAKDLNSAGLTRINADLTAALHRTHGADNITV